MKAEMAFQQLKHDIDVWVNAIDESILFEVETDASAATVNQAGRSVAFFSSTLQRPDTRQASIERETQAIIETVRHWRHYGKHLILKTDQQAVMYMFDNRKNIKIKNDKVVRWRMGISCFNFNSIIQPREGNISWHFLEVILFIHGRGSSTIIQYSRPTLPLRSNTRVCTTSWHLAIKHLSYSVEDVGWMTLALANVSLDSICQKTAISLTLLRFT